MDSGVSLAAAAIVANYCVSLPVWIIVGMIVRMWGEAAVSGWDTLSLPQLLVHLAATSPGPFSGQQEVLDIFPFCFIRFPEIRSYVSACNFPVLSFARKEHGGFTRQRLKFFFSCLSVLFILRSKGSPLYQCLFSQTSFFSFLFSVPDHSNSVWCVHSHLHCLFICLSKLSFPFSPWLIRLLTHTIAASPFLASFFDQRTRLFTLRSHSSAVVSAHLSKGSVIAPFPLFQFRILIHNHAPAALFFFFGCRKYSPYFLFFDRQPVDMMMATEWGKCLVAVSLGNGHDDGVWCCPWQAAVTSARSMP